MKLVSFVIAAAGGFAFIAAGTASRGADFRPNRADNLAELIAQQTQRHDELIQQAKELRETTDQLAAATGEHSEVTELPAPQMMLIGLTEAHGSGVRVTLSDAPADFNPINVDGDLLVVHEHDIQLVVNALWQAGAEAIAIQNQRVVATTAVKCVGNTVVVNGTAYAPPYVITAIGDPQGLEQGLNNDRGLQLYRKYAEIYQLGYQQQRIDQIVIPAYQGALPQQAKVVR